MRAVVWQRPGQLKVTEVPDPAPGHGELIIQVGACGICGTDVHIADGNFPPTPYPIIPGHEFSGRVMALGHSVPGGWREGERVAVDPSLFCGYCPACRAGRGNLCANWNAIGDTVDGAFAEYVAVPAANAYRIPDNVDDSQGALIEPLSCAVHGLRRIGPVLGQDVLLMGAGTMGLLLLQLLARAGARSLTVVDRKASRLEPPRPSERPALPTMWPRSTARPSPWPWTRPARPVRSKPPSNHLNGAAGCSSSESPAATRPCRCPRSASTTTRSGRWRS